MTVKCSHCNAPLEFGQARCTYCGGLNDIDLSGRHYYTTHAPETPRVCAGCGAEMQTINLQSDAHPFYIERCPQCLGLFFDPNELDTFVDETIRQVFTIDHLRLFRLLQESGAEERVRYVKCPVCRKIMNRVNFGKSSGVVVDQCREHGIYLDAGELQRILQWARAGGRERQAEREQEGLDSQKLPSAGNPRFRDISEPDDDSRIFLKKLATLAARLF